MPLWYDKINPDHKEPIICEQCKSTGKVIDCIWGSFAPDIDYKSCEKCNGTGYLNKD